MAEPPPSSDDSSSSYCARRYSEEDVTEMISRRAKIEQAKGVLMHVYEIDADQAFDMLRARSRASRIQIRELAEQILNDPFLAKTLAP